VRITLTVPAVGRFGPAAELAIGSNPPVQPLPRTFYDRQTETVAKDLLGMHLAHQVDGVLRVGRIVETEA
jgi:hypothetical protein